MARQPRFFAVHPLLIAALALCLSLTGGEFAVAQGTATTATRVGPAVSETIEASVYRARRDRLMKELGGCATAIKSRSTGDALDHDFFYLTGIEEPGVVLTLAPRARVVKQSLAFPARNPRAEIWTGYKEVVDATARKKYAVDEVRESANPGASRTLRNGIRRGKCFAYLRFPSTRDDLSPKLLGRLLKGYGARTVQRWEALEQMRAIKEPGEIQRMRKAIAITFKGHEAAVQSIKAGVLERQVSSAIRGAFYAAGGTGLAFPSIVGSGPNGAVLHWVRNDRQIARNDMVVIDIGASFGKYAADITRTYPSSGQFSKEQQGIYETVLKVQNEIIDMARPGVTMTELNRAAQRKIEAAGYELPHGLGHFVGLQVHDVGDSDAPLEAGMVITVEPGIYLKGKFGVRIEDMVLITDRGNELLTKNLPRTPSELETWMKSIRSAKK